MSDTRFIDWLNAHKNRGIIAKWLVSVYGAHHMADYLKDGVMLNRGGEIIIRNKKRRSFVAIPTLLTD